MDLDLDNLTALRVLGRGAMGTVFLVSDLSSSSSPSPPFALKVIDKNCPKAKPDSDRRARWELSVLARLSHPFLPSLIGYLETSTLFAYAFPFCPGGDLNTLRHSLSDRVFSPCAIKFYLSEILTALSHLHSMNIVYRDLKPENILIKSDGHIVLSDFDLSRYLQPRVEKVSDIFAPECSAADSPPHHHPPPGTHRRNLTRMFFRADNFSFGRNLKKAKSARVSPVSRKRNNMTTGFHKSNSFVGTEEYVAPEIIRGEGHEFSVDFWALGVLTYEMAYGATPFKGKNRKETFRNVLTRQPEFIGQQPTELTDLMARLLAKDPTRRLGYNGGAEEIKKHPFFQGVRWEMLAEVSRPPFFATAEELEEAAIGLPGGDHSSGFDIRDYYEKIHAPVRSESSSMSEF